MARPANPELRDAILAAATEIIEGCGPDCVTMREVAEKVGYSPTTIYLYFKDKSEVLKETVKAASADLGVALRSASVGPTPLDTLRQRGRAYLVWGITHPGLYQLMFQQPGDIVWTAEELDAPSDAGAETNEVLRQAIEAGQIKEMADPALTQTAIFAALHGATSLAISRRIAHGAVDFTGPELVAAAAGVADALLDALLAPVPADR